MGLRVKLVDKNVQGIRSVIESLSLCRDKTCSYETVENVMRARPFPHMSALENLWYKFSVEGLSIKARIQLERHRILSSMERSTRAIDMSDAEFVIPPTAKDNQAFEFCYQEAISNYKDLIASGETLEDAAYVLPTGTTTKFTMAGNGRVFFEYLQKRLCYEHVQREHWLFASEIYCLLIDEDPIFKLASPCPRCGACKDRIIVRKRSGRGKDNEWRLL